ncbi:CoA-transferase family III [Apiospora sp. TS-2023a]
MIGISIFTFKASEHGKANADVGLFEIEHHPDPTNQPPAWWPNPTNPHSSIPTHRPLAGLKVVDLTRVIAGPAVSRGLAELGASVMRITAPHLTDMSALHPDLNHGKWNACLDLRTEEGRKALRDLVMGADVLLQGYRPGVLDKYGFGEKDVLEMGRERGRGIVYCGENCYGWQGPWMERSGWQQISDACCGVSYEFGRAMGNDEPVTPVFPNSDYCTGVAGVVGIITALLGRAEEGGSYTVKIALNYYSQWLVNSAGTYPPAVWADLWQRNGSPVFRHHHPMQYLLPRTLALVAQNSGKKLFRPEFFTQYRVKSIDKDIRIVAPVLRYPNGEVKPGFDIGTRTNGVDQPVWPDDLGVEVVGKDGKANSSL